MNSDIYFSLWDVKASDYKSLYGFICDLGDPRLPFVPAAQPRVLRLGSSPLIRMPLFISVYIDLYANSKS